MDYCGWGKWATDWIRSCNGRRLIRVTKDRDSNGKIMWRNEKCHINLSVLWHDTHTKKINTHRHKRTHMYKLHSERFEIDDDKRQEPLMKKKENEMYCVVAIKYALRIFYSTLFVHFIMIIVQCAFNVAFPTTTRIHIWLSLFLSLDR